MRYRLINLKLPNVIIHYNDKRKRFDVDEMPFVSNRN